MTSRTRYGLLAAGIVFFLVAAPFIVIFVGGFRYSPATHGFVRTGAISAYTDPKGAEFSLDGSAKGTTPKSVRFLLPGDYDVSLTKSGYRPWTKRLNVAAGVVTSANLGLNNVTLFYDVPLITPIAADATGFFAGGKRLVYTTASHVYAADISTPTRTSSLALQIPQEVASGAMSITASADENYFLLRGGAGGYLALFSAPNNTLTDLNPMLTPVIGKTKISDIQFGANGSLYVLAGGTLYAVDWSAGTVQPIVNDDIVAFSAHGDGLYVLCRDSGSADGTLSLEHINPATLQSSVLYPGLPDWQTASLYLNQSNQPALIGNGDLYAISDTGEYAQQYVQSISPEDGTTKMLYATNNELGLFDPGDGDIAVITRSSQPITASGVSMKTGWAFYIAAGQLQAIELDNRDQQNTYSLERVSAGATFSIDSSAQYVYLLSGGLLERLQIR